MSVQRVLSAFGALAAMRDVRHSCVLHSGVSTCDLSLSQAMAEAKTQLLVAVSEARPLPRICSLVAADAAASSPITTFPTTPSHLGAPQSASPTVDDAAEVVRLGLAPAGGIRGTRTTTRFLMDDCLTASSTARLAPLLTREANATYVWFARRGRRSAIVELHERRGGGAGVRVLLRSGDTSRVDATAGVETAAFDEEVASLHGVPRPSLALLALHHMLTRGGCSAVRLFTGTADCSQNCSSHDKPSLSTTGQSRPPLEPLACDAGLAAMDLLGPLGNESFVFLDLREYVSKLILRESSLEPARGESHGHQKLMGHRNGGTPAVRG